MGKAALAGLALAAAPAAAQSGWGGLGEQEIGPQAASASISVDSGDPVDEIMFCVEQAPVRFRALTIRYREGTTQQIEFRDRIAAGRCGRPIQVRRRAGAIAAIDIAYLPDSLGGANAEVQAFGR